jgi:hypothetical protein
MVAVNTPFGGWPAARTDADGLLFRPIRCVGLTANVQWTCGKTPHFPHREADHMSTMADTHMHCDAGFTVSPEEYIAQVEAAVARGDAPSYMADGLRRALAVAVERESRGAPIPFG